VSRFKIAACTGTHIGDRKEQQDRVALVASKRAPGCVLAIVCDGMGGKTGGAIAAQQVVTTATNLFQDFSPNDTPVETLMRAIAEEAHTIIKLSALSSEKEPHSTMVAVVVQSDSANWAHIGDSRLYHYRGERLMNMTVDHSYVNQLVAEGRLAQEDAKNHRLSNVITNAIGTEKMPDITFGGTAPLDAGDCFLLCTDGLWHYFSDEEIGEVLASQAPRVASEMLIDEARTRAGGKGDNCSLAIIKLEHAAG
jgi:serine/threonine protein phosphatase PrpC